MNIILSPDWPTVYYMIRKDRFNQDRKNKIQLKTAKSLPLIGSYNFIIRFCFNIFAFQLL